MNLEALSRSLGLAAGVWAACLAAGAAAQENLDLGKSPAQLYASDCAICHKSPRGLIKGEYGLEGFLRLHYTASRETAAAIANYLRSVDTGPAAPRATKRTAKGDEKSKPDEKKKPEAKPGETKAGEKPDASAGAQPGPKASESKPAEILAPEPTPAQPKASTPAAGDAKPGEGGKPEKQD